MGEDQSCPLLKGLDAVRLTTNETIHLTQLFPGWVLTHKAPKTILPIMPGPIKFTANVSGIAPMSPVCRNPCLTPDQDLTINTMTVIKNRKKCTEIMKERKKNVSVQLYLK